MFTNNCRDEVTLIFLKHKYREYMRLLDDDALDYDATLQMVADTQAILKTFAEVRERNAQNLQAGSYEAIAKQCEDFFKSTAEPAQVG